MSSINPVNSAYPPAADVFTDKVDEDVQIIENITIPSAIPFVWQLQKVPKGPVRNINGTVDPTTIYIRDFREIEGTPQQSGQFNVDYNVGLISFHPLDKGRAIVCQYKTAGDFMQAQDFNKLQDAVFGLEQFAITPYLVAPDLTKWYLKITNEGVLQISNQP